MEHQTGGSADAQGVGRGDRPLGRGLEDVAHLFLSRTTHEPTGGNQAPAQPTERSSSPSCPTDGFVRLRSSTITREQLGSMLRELDGAIEDGLRALDTNIPCHPCGQMDLLAVDRASQLTIIDFDTTSNDRLLLRGLGHFDWAMHNLPNVRRMYAGQPINFALPPRLVLVAPQFSPLVRCIARQITRPQIGCIRYHVVDALGRSGILFDPVVGE